MWVFVANIYGGYGTLGQNDGRLIEHGQLFFQDESNPSVYHTWDLNNARFTSHTAYNHNAELAEFTYWDSYWNDWRTGWFERLDRWNCKEYGMCHTDGVGSRYSLRSSINVYRADGSYYGAISSTNQIVFARGYGYTKATSVSQITGSGVGIRVYGYRRSDGSTVAYGEELYASESFKTTPDYYKINTL